jgi:hypothetical protein
VPHERKPRYTRLCAQGFGVRLRQSGVCVVLRFLFFVHVHMKPRPGWAPDPLLVGIRSLDGLVVGSCTSHSGVLGSIPKREEPGKTGRHPVLKYRVPHGSQDPDLPSWRGAGGGGLLAGTRRRPAAEDGVPPSLQIPPHTCILLTRSPAPYSPFRRRAHSPTAFSGPMARPPPPPPRPPPSNIHAGWMVSATKTPTSSAPSQDSLFPLYM